MNKYTEGSILKSLLSLAIPVVLTNVLHTAYQLTDTFWVGRLGKEAVASVAISFPVIFLMMSLASGFTIAGTILIAQYKGKNDINMLNHITSQTFVIVSFLSVLISGVCFIFAEEIMSLIGGNPDFLVDATSYLKISAIGMFFVFNFFCFQSLMRGIGQVKVPMLVVLFTVLLNLFLDPLFINGYGFIPSYGVKGAAIATMLTQALATLISFYILVRGRYEIKLSLKNFYFDKELVKKMFFLGLPASIEQSMKALGFAIISFLVASFGTTIMAAYGIGFRMLSFVIIPAFGLSMATSTLVGQNIGAGKIDRAEQIAKISSTFGFIVLMIAGVVFGIFSTEIITLFVPNELDVIKEGSFFLRILSLSFGFIGFQLTLNGALQGSGNTKVTMLLSIVSLWLLEFPFAYILSKYTNLGSTGIWVAPVLSAFITALIVFVYFNLGRWKHNNVINVSK